MANILSFVALGLCGAATLFALLAVALPYWTDNDFGNTGLFRSCVKIPQSVCVDAIDVAKLTGNESPLRATQAMVLLGFFALIGTLIVIVLAVFVMKDKKILGYVAAGLAIVAGFFLMVGMGIYADKLAGTSDYGAGFAFDILGWLAAWATGGLMGFLTIRGGNEAPPS